MRFTKSLASVALAGLLSAAPGFASSSAPVAVSQATLEKDVNRAIQTLAWYGVFDNIEFQVKPDGRVTLVGQVASYVVQRDAVSAVKHVPGVTGVDDKIEVLPLSPFDNSIRVRAYNAIFGYPALSRYAINARSPIRILVKNGNVTLAGFVSNDLDRKLVEMRVRTLPATFQVTNNLQVDGQVSGS